MFYTKRLDAFVNKSVLITNMEVWPLLWIWINILLVASNRPILKQTCGSIPLSSTTGSSYLNFNCGSEFGGNGVIAVKKVCYGRGKTCKPRASNLNCQREITFTSDNILSANGLEYYKTAILPLKVPWPRAYMYVQYECYNRKDFRNVCDSFETRSYNSVNMISPHYAAHSNGDVIPATACVCNASVPVGAKLTATLIDFDLYHEFGPTCREGLHQEYLGILELLHFPSDVCSRFQFPLNVTLPQPSWTFVYSAEFLHLEEATRGFWFQIGGISSSDRPVPMKLSCAQFEMPDDGPAGLPVFPFSVPDADQSTNEIGIIIGATVGGLTALVLSGMAVFFCLRRKHLKASRDATEIKQIYTTSGEQTPPHPNSPVRGSASSTDDGIYWIRGDPRDQSAQYEVMGGISNPAHEYLNLEGVPVVRGFPDYENVRCGAGNRNLEYCHLKNQGSAKTITYEKLTN